MIMSEKEDTGWNSFLRHQEENVLPEKTFQERRKRPGRLKVRLRRKYNGRYFIAADKMDNQSSAEGKSLRKVPA